MALLKINMRKISELEHEIKRLVDSRHELEKPRQISQAGKKVSFLKMCVEYLRNQPTEEYIEKEYDRLEARLKKIEKDYANFKPAKAVSEKEKRKEFENLHKIPLLKEQMRTLRFILN